MPVVREEPVLRFIRKLAVREQTARLPDRELLERFVNTREEEAFAALLRRHGRMVLRVCVQVLDNEHDAEDAFQATFLVLIRKASSVKKRESIGSWLFGVANHTAKDLKKKRTRRRSHESQASQPMITDPLTALTLREGLGEGGGLYINPLASVCLDAFTVANVINNTASYYYPNIYGSYTICP